MLQHFRPCLSHRFDMRGIFLVLRCSGWTCFCGHHSLAVIDWHPRYYLRMQNPVYRQVTFPSTIRIKSFALPGQITSPRLHSRILGQDIVVPNPFGVL